MEPLNVYPQPIPGVLSRIIDGEAVLVMAKRGVVKVLNKVGTRIWTLIDGSRTVEEIASIIGSEYAVDIETAQADTLEFIQQMVDRNMITLSDQKITGVS
jgi:hypothetical protein